MLHPDPTLVEEFLADPVQASWVRFERKYRNLLEKRFKEDPAPFDEIAKLAGSTNVFLGCNCPTAKNPDVNHCYTVAALGFMRKKYPKLKIVFPKSSG